MRRLLNILYVTSEDAWLRKDGANLVVEVDGREKGRAPLHMLEGVVSFPSFHTILGVIPIYALRDRRALMMAALAVNGTMIVSTMPVGGHHLIDVVAGAAVSLGAILVTRRYSTSPSS